MADSKKPKRYNIMGVMVDALTMDQAAELIVARATKPGAVYVTKPYVEFLDRASADTDIATLLNGSFLTLPDGVSAQWAAQYLYGGQPSFGRWLGTIGQIVFQPSRRSKLVPERFGGTNFSWQMLELAAKNKLKVFIVGQLTHQDISRVAATIQKRLPNLKIVGTHPGVMGGLSKDLLQSALSTEPVEASLVNQINSSGAQLILIGMGFPLQERLMAKMAPQLPGGVMVGEGGTFDYSSFGGKRSKAPSWMQRVGLEWLWRLILEPTRIGRQLAIIRFMVRIYHAGRRQS